MAVELRFSRAGVRSRPFYRLVAVERASKRDGKRLEILGTYDPMQSPPLVKVNEERVRRWIGVGARITRTSRRIIMKAIPGLIEDREKHQVETKKTAHQKRKQRIAKLGSKKKSSAPSEKLAKKEAKRASRAEFKKKQAAKKTEVKA